MKIEINNHRKIYAIQKEFSGLFPFLKIEFHEKPHTNGGPASEKIVKSGGKTLAECRNTHMSGHLTITPNMTSGDLKQCFRDTFGLTIELFQKVKKNGWRKIDVSENETLDNLNKEVAFSGTTPNLTT
ncbi:MAG: hypothetical protein K0R26_1551 [Bacteroidota bacterium]|jgi:hypothetical protein|nr:hypothetical protein [Bacteroidota bacterium]